MDVLPDGYKITTRDIKNALWYEGFSLHNLRKGDVILIYTGWERYSRDKDLFYDTDKGPTLLMETFTDIFGPHGIMVIGMDQPTMEIPPFPIHQYWIVCKGGLFHEGLSLQKWINDARSGKAPYKGAYIFAPFDIEGAVGSPGRPMVYV